MNSVRGGFARSLVPLVLLLPAACQPAAPVTKKVVAEPDRETMLGCGVAGLVLKDARAGEIPDANHARIQLLRVVARTSRVSGVALAADDLVDAAAEGKAGLVRRTARRLRDACIESRVPEVDMETQPATG